MEIRPRKRAPSLWGKSRVILPFEEVSRSFATQPRQGPEIGFRWPRMLSAPFARHSGSQGQTGAELASAAVGRGKFNNQAGDIWVEDGLRYYMQSKEAGRHHLPHIHVDYRHESSATVSLYDGEMIEGDIPKKVMKRVKAKVLNNKKYLMECWNKLTDGLRVDLNASMRCSSTFRSLRRGRKNSGK